MDSKPFEDSFAKIENARDHITLAKKRFDDFIIEGPAVRIASRGGLAAINFGPTNPTPKGVALAVGDAIHNLRSALDIMAVDIVQLSGGSRKDVYFPFAESASEMEAQIRKKNFSRASPDAVNLLRSFNPYKGGDVALRAIHDLDITDKHIFTIPVSREIRVSNIQLDGILLSNITLSGNGRNDISFGNHQLPVGIGSVRTDLVFARGKPLAGEKVIPALHGLADLTFGVVEAFSTLFKGQGGGNPAGSGPPG